MVTKTTLEERLKPILAELRTAKPFSQQRSKIVRTHFENAPDGELTYAPEEILYLCSIPFDDSSVLRCPLIGNWFLEKLREYDPLSEHQKQVSGLMREVLAESRFVNGFMPKTVEEAALTALKIKLYQAMYLNPEESKVLLEFLNGIYGEMHRLAVQDRSYQRTKSYTPPPHIIGEPSFPFARYLSVEYHHGFIICTSNDSTVRWR